MTKLISLPGAASVPHLLAAVAVLQALKVPCQITLHNNNGYLINGMAKRWAARWREAGWKNSEGKPAAHADLWDALLELSAVHQVEWVWLPTEGLDEFDQCHRLAHHIREFIPTRNPLEGLRQAVWLCAV